jgi:hypothetical protein
MVSEFGRYQPTFADKVAGLTDASPLFWLGLLAAALLNGTPAAAAVAIALFVLALALARLR